MAGEELSEMDDSLEFTSENFDPEKALVSNSVSLASSSPVVFNNLNKYVESLFKSESFRSLNWLPDEFSGARGRAQAHGRSSKEYASASRIYGQANTCQGDAADESKSSVTSTKDGNSNTSLASSTFRTYNVTEIPSRPESSKIITSNVAASNISGSKKSVVLNNRAERLQNLMVGELEEESPDEKKRRKRPNVLERMEASQEGPLSILYRSMNQGSRLKVWTRRYKGLRGVCIGYLIAFDKHMNLAMIDVDEVYTIEIRMLSAEEQAQIRHAKKKEKRNRYRLNRVRRGMDLPEDKGGDEQATQCQSEAERNQALRIEHKPAIKDDGPAISNVCQRESLAVAGGLGTSSLQDVDCGGATTAEDSKDEENNKEPVSKDEVEYCEEEERERREPEAPSEFALPVLQNDSVSAVTVHQFKENNSQEDATCRQLASPSLIGEITHSPTICNFFMFSGSSPGQSRGKPEQVLKFPGQDTQTLYKHNEMEHNEFTCQAKVRTEKQGVQSGIHSKDSTIIVAGLGQTDEENIVKGEPEDIKRNRSQQETKKRSFKYNLAKLDLVTKKCSIDVTRLIEQIGIEQCRKDPRVCKALSKHQRNVEECTQPISLSREDHHESQVATTRDSVNKPSSLTPAKEKTTPRNSSQKKTEDRTLSEGNYQDVFHHKDSKKVIKEVEIPEEAQKKSGVENAEKRSPEVEGEKVVLEGAYSVKEAGDEMMPSDPSLNPSIKQLLKTIVNVGKDTNLKTTSRADSSRTKDSQATVLGSRVTNKKDSMASKSGLPTLPALTEHVVRRRHVNQLFIRGDNIVLVALDN